MPLPDSQFIIRLAELADPPLLCDLLDISSEALLERFDDVVEDRIDELRKIFDVDIDESLEDDNERGE
jgi:hypothetical protein